jgi:hypothetical protein
MRSLTQTPGDRMGSRRARAANGFPLAPGSGRLGDFLETGMEATQALAERITRTILYLRGEKVLLDEDPALLYEVGTKSLVRAVKRNPDRFPEDFMFQLSEEE